jgi:hypothetical protein
LPKGGEAITQAGSRGFTRGIFCRDYDVHCWKIQLCEAKGLFDQAANAISRNATAHGFHRNRETYARTTASVRHHTQAEKAIVDPTTASVYRIELELAAQARFSAEAQTGSSGLHGARAERTRRQGTIFLRPFDRRRARTFLPPVDFMRARKPVARLRLILLG